ncbi:ankyrin repeat domain-containing protein [archaeon]|nr:MAG: ankyrin repeat domain-containing protein [archaeon]
MKASNKDLLGSSPYDFGLSVDIVKKTKKINKMLHEEKKDFMAKLNITRFVRSKLENDAATKLQSIYRGYNTRKNLGEISHFLDINHMIRANLRSYLDSSNYSTLTLGQYTRERQVVRNCAATLIQCAFRMFLSRKYLRRRKCEQNLRRKVHAAVVIQARARGISARARVKVLIEKRRIILYRLSVIKIQSALRGMFSRRRVYRRRYRLQFLAARMIQSWYRAKYSRKMTNHIKSVMHFRQSNKGAMLMQTVVRRFLSIRRVNRIRLRKFHVLISSWVIRMQCLARKFLAKVTLRKKKQLVQQKVVEEQLKRATELRKEQQAKIDEESKSLLEGADIFVQAEKGNTVGVEDIFKGLMGGVHTVHDVNAQGDNLITISAKVGNSDLLRKCIMWGFNINHRNMDGHLAIALAAKNNHLPAFQYLFSFYNSAENATEKQVLQLTEEDIGFLLVSAAANCAIADMTMLQALIAQGVDVNTPSVNGMTAIHAACEIGHIEAFKLLLKNKAKPEGVDETGQSPLHKACSSSLQLVQWILGLDPEFSTYMAESTRYASVVTVDADGKDCVLHAALAGQTEVVELLDSIIQNGGGLQSSSQSGKRKGGGGEEDNHEEISWSAQDITKAVNLVSTGNVFCLHRILDAGFDADWQDVDTGLSMSLASCKRGDTDIIDQLLEKGADFSLVDQLGRNCMHYAAMAGENSSSLAVFLITHPAAAKCKLSKSLLLAKDQTGDTPFHIAAREGSEINVDLLASDIFPAVLNVRNEDGMTPLLLACRYYREKLIHVYLKLGADALAVDNHDRGCMWHLFHPEASILNVRRPLCSEFVIITLQGSNASFNRKEKDEEVAKLAAEISTVVALLKAGCTLYTDYGGTPEDVLRLPYKSFVPPTAPHDPDSEPGDVILQELSMGLIKAIVPSVVSPLDAWRLCKFCIHYFYH